MLTDFLAAVVDMGKEDDSLFYSDGSCEEESLGDEDVSTESTIVGSVNVSNVAGDLTSLAVCGDGYNTWHIWMPGGGLSAKMCFGVMSLLVSQTQKIWGTEG